MRSPSVPNDRPQDERRTGAAGLALALAFLGGTLSGCDDGYRHFTRSMVLGGVRVSAERLDAGLESYTHYCRACHGDKGDGRGVSALGLRPPPRDFTQGKFKFAAVESGNLPNDDDFHRIVRSGLHGTAMLAWDVPEDELNNIIPYIKTFSPKWQKGKPGKPVVTPPDPWQGNEPAAVARGKELYHVTTQCAGCHPNYATKDDIAQMTLRTKKFQVTGFRDDMYGSVLKESEYRTTLRPIDEPAHPAHAAHKRPAKGEAAEASGAEGKAKEEAKTEGEETSPARYFMVSILPPDFTRSELRSGDTPGDLYRTIACGVGGTAMPAWIATAPYTDPTTGEHWDGEKDIWALSHYVRSLVDLKGTPRAEALRRKLLDQPSWSPSL